MDESISNSNTTPLSHKRHITGVVTRKKRNSRKTVIIDGIPTTFSESASTVSLASDSEGQSLKGLIKNISGHCRGSLVSNLTEGSEEYLHNLEREYNPESSALLDASLFDNDDGSSSTTTARSIGSNRSRSSNRSVLSDQIHKASRRGEERAHDDSQSISSEREQGKSYSSSSSATSKGGSSSSRSIKRSVEKSAIKASNNYQRPTSTKLSSQLSSSSAAEDWESSSLGSKLSSNKYNDHRYIAKSAISKFDKGVYLARRSKFKMSREKLRGALKARILLYEDINHGSIAPVHEMLGHVELKLRDWDKARLHFRAAKKICEGQLGELLKEDGGGDEDVSVKKEGGGGDANEENSSREILVTNIARINKALEQVQLDVSGRGGEQSQDVAFSIIAEETITCISDSLLRFDQTIMERGRKRQSDFDIIKEVDDEVEDVDVNVEANKKVAISQEKKRQQQTKRMSTHSEERLRMTYMSKSQVGEEQYNNKQYEMAMASFNESRCALLMIAGLPEKSQRGDLGSEAYCELRDQVNNALLSERITDCQVVKFFRGSKRHLDEVEVTDISHINYQHSTNQLQETRANIKKELDLRLDHNKRMDGSDDDKSVDSFHGEKKIDLDAFQELLKTATESLARVFSKQGAYLAKLSHHIAALDLFQQSLSSWSESANKTLESSTSLNMGVLAANINPLIVETNMLITKDDTEERSSAYAKTIQLLQSNDTKALSTALQMASSYHALGIEMLDEDSRVALENHVNAYGLIRAAQRMRLSLNVTSLSIGQKPRRLKGAALKVIGDSNRRLKKMTTRVRDLSVLSNASASEGENIGSFMKRCELFKAAEQVHIAHVTFRLGKTVLSSKWLAKAMDTMDEVGISLAKNEASLVKYMLSVMMNAAPEQSNRGGRLVANPLALYENGLPTFTDGYNGKDRVHVHWALEEVQKRLHIDAMYTAEQAVDSIRELDSPPSYSDEYLRAIDVQIAIKLKYNDNDGVLEKLKLRLTIISRWEGDGSLATANELRRLACFYSIRGDHLECLKLLNESLGIIFSLDGKDQDSLAELTKFAGTVYEALGQSSKAIEEYERALSLMKEGSVLESAKVMNAISQSFIKKGKSNEAIDYLEKSMQSQKCLPNKTSETNNLLADTLVLYGNAMASKHSFSEAIFWYDSALNANPNKSPLEHNNLRAWYNKGVALFHIRDIVGAGHAFGIILDEVEETSAVTHGISFVLNGIGNIVSVYMKKRLFLLFQSLSMAYSPSSSQHFTNKIYVKALEAYNESLTTERDDTFTPIQRVGILCNIATTHFMMSEFEESESHFQRALVEADSSGKYCWDIKALIMSKLAYVLYKREFYNRAYDLYSEGEFLSDCSYDFFATIMPRQINITTSCYSSLKPKLHLFNRRTRALSRDAKDVLKCVEFSS